MGPGAGVRAFSPAFGLDDQEHSRLNEADGDSARAPRRKNNNETGLK
jgi:hypothetical protein